MEHRLTPFLFQQDPGPGETAGTAFLLADPPEPTKTPPNTPRRQVFLSLNSHCKKIRLFVISQDSVVEEKRQGSNMLGVLAAEGYQV